MGHDPRDFQLDPDESVLGVIDIQTRLVAAIEPKDFVHGASLLIRGARILEVPILVSEQYPQGLGDTVGEVREAIGEFEPVTKVHFDCAAAPGYVDRLQQLGRRTVILCGIEAHVCVLQTAAGLLRAGFAVWVAEDGIASRREANRLAAVRSLEQVGAIVAPVETILFLLLGQAGGPAFKQISKLVK